ncbi:MAG: threonylcarbamoyl-AMP synthase [Gammaproteobacteria bacterium]|nr:threonylcarbamoyl-AMP synthase [Gammaproteobacteria bacterium]
MSQYFRIHADNPQPRLIKHAVEIIRKGGVVIYPTDSAYAIGCHIGDKSALDRIIKIRQLDKKHSFSIICQDLSSISYYAKVANSHYRLLKAYTPGPYTFILPATSEVPRRLMHPKRKTIGIRVPNNAIALALLSELGEPLMTATLLMPGDEYPLCDPEEIRSFLERQVDLIIDGGYGMMEETTMVEMIEDAPVIVREGFGDPSPFQ